MKLKQFLYGFAEIIECFKDWKFIMTEPYHYYNMYSFYKYLGKTLYFKYTPEKTGILTKILWGFQDCHQNFMNWRVIMLKNDLKLYWMDVFYETLGTELYLD